MAAGDPPEDRADDTDRAGTRDTGTRDTGATGTRDTGTAGRSDVRDRAGDADKGFTEAQAKAADPSSAGEWQDLRAKFDTAKQWLGGGTTNVFFGEARVGSLGDHYATAGVASAHSAHFGVVVNSGPVPAAMLADIRESYVEPARYGHLRAVLESHQVVVIRAPDGTGRTATALRLLDDLCREGVLKLDPDVNLKTVDGSAFSGLRGYLLESLDPEQARELRAFHAERLCALMKDKGCMLVVIADDRTPLPVEDIGHLVVDDLGEVEPSALIRRHLDWGLSAVESPRAGAAVLDLPEVREIVTALTPDVPRRQLADLGALLVDVATGRIDVEVVRERYSATSRANFVSWFDQQTDVEQRAFVIALAVFNDEPVHLVSGAATMLADLVKEVELPRRADRGRALFATPLSRRLEDARAEVVEDTERTRIGNVTVRKARFRDDRYPALVLAHLCTEYDQGLTVVTRWLRELGGALGGRVRVRAGMAAGFLSTYDFFGIHHEVVQPWADADDPYTRDAAVAALQFPSDHPALGRVVHKLLDAWLRDRENWSRRKTAARALGSTTAASPAAVLRLLKRTARHVDWTTAFMIGESVSDLLCRVDDPVQVLDALVAWSDDDEFPLRRETALLAVLVASNYLTVSVAESAEKWPALLWLAEDGEPARSRVVLLFARMLQTADFLGRGYEHLRRWLRLAQRDRTLRAPVARLLFDIGTEMDDLDSVRHYVETWGAGRGGPADAARAVLDHFDEGAN
ncbi:hypothetical protein [Saccharothrix australiensis]|uniref:Uncharacterized protein n=1 Tax=Saccharothrix australiensis TaxID=2072 RepID=A0A495W113_9PSEU|nr:hypothetical protein [Saccharothrix australiensis]RKT54810.1 hypothetical protein C8E97_3459 [Saccharothrix australiensis]